MKKNPTLKLCAAAALVAFAALSVDAAGAADEIKALRGIIESNSVDRTTKCRYYKAWYAEQCTKAELVAMLERNIAAHRRWIELDPGSAEPLVGLGSTLAAVGRWAEAKQELEKALTAKGDLQKTRACWELANCLWQAGDKDGAKKLIQEFLKSAETWPSAIGMYIKRAKYLDMMFKGDDSDLDVFTLPHSTDGKPFPTPQSATYGEKKVSLARVEIRVKGLKAADPIVRLLKKKLSRFGVEFEKGGTPIEIELSPNAPVDKPQGYSLDVANGRVVVNARSWQGALWGAVSLIQCVDRGGLAIRECEIRDWPKCQRRGVIDYWDWRFLEYALFNKMNCMNIRMDNDYIPSPLDRERYRLWCARFREFGIEMFCGSGNIMMTPILPLSSPRTRKLHVGWARFIASVGAGFALHMDDSRFPMHPLDLEKAGAAANLDAKYLTGIYQEVKKDYPDFKFLFCPPFYWGPDGGVNYPEPRDAYLKSLGTDLDPEIEVFWTGPRVKSGGMSVDKTKWYSDLIGRKPVIFHNSDCKGRHNHIPYGADVSGYKASHAPELFDMISAFMHNMSRYQGAPAIGSCMDWCWNPDAHDPEVAVRRNDEQLEGPGVFEILRDATPSLSYFDKYCYGRARSELFAEDADDLDKRVADAEAAWAKVLPLAHNNGLFVEDFNRCGILWARQLARYRRNPPKWLVEQRDAEMANTKFAIDEVGYDESKKDEFFPAEMLAGGMYVTNIGDWSNRGKRNVKYLAPQNELFGRFQCVLFPPERPFTLVLQGKSFERDKKPFFEVEVNGRVVWRGETFDTPYYFKKLEIEIPIDALQRTNLFKIRNVGPDVHDSCTAIIHYAVVKKYGEAGAKASP